MSRSTWILGSAAAIWLVAAGLLAACGARSSSSESRARAASDRGDTVDIYSSLPTHGAVRAQTVAMENGIMLALWQAGSRAGPWRISYTALDDASSATGAWDPILTAKNAQRAAADTDTVFYIGEFDSAASEVSIPILNQAGIAQVSPSTYAGLTIRVQGVARDDPSRYYPSNVRSFLRIVPSDSVQAPSDLLAMRQAGCTRVAVANDRGEDGAGLASLIWLDRLAYGVDIVSNKGIDPGAGRYESYVATIRADRVNCFMYAGAVSSGAVELTDDVHAALPAARIFGSNGVCTSTWTNAADGGVSGGVDPRIECTVATPQLGADPAGARFLAAYRARYGVANPDPYAAFGYEAMKLALDTIRHLGTQGDSKSAVLKALFATAVQHSLLGAYAFERDGDTTLSSYGLYKVGTNRDPVFSELLTPSKAA
jgi:branched-chain amino acid transport system substrate-binding protein